MKKYILSFLLFLSVSTFSQTATLSMPDDLIVSAGQQVVVPIKIDDIRPTGEISGFLVSVLYDPEAMTWIKSQNLNSNAPTIFFAENGEIPGDYRGNWLDVMNLTTFHFKSGEVLLELVFEVKAESDLVFSLGKTSEDVNNTKVATEISDANYALYKLKLKNGKVRVKK